MCKERRERKYRMTNIQDPNDQWDLEADNLEDACLKVLEELGWGISEIDKDEEDVR